MRPMLVAISRCGHAAALQAGFERHGLKTVMIHGDTVVEEADIHVIWSVKRPNIFTWANRTDRHVLVAERGHLQDRMYWTSLGWNGLANRGMYAKAPDGERWTANWGHLLKPWKEATTGAALLIGQSAGDASLYGLGQSFESWAEQQTTHLKARYQTVYYRPHPNMVQRGDRFCPRHAIKSVGKTLDEDLNMVDLAVSYNSTAGVEAVLAGVPTVTLDEGSMAFSVSGHKLDEIVRPDRTQWCHQLAWTSFSLDEISSGFAWEAVSKIIEVPV